MSDSLSLMIIDVFVRKENYKKLLDLDLNRLQSSLERTLIADDPNCEVEVILRIEPVVSLKNTIEVKFATINKRTDYINDTDACEQLRAFLLSKLPIKINDISFKQENSGSNFTFSKEN